MALLARVTGRVYLLNNNSYIKYIFNYSHVKKSTRNCENQVTFNSYSCNVRFTHTEPFKMESRQNRYVMYNEIMAQRRLQAQRSILVEVQSIKSYVEVHRHCSQFGKINGLFYYMLGITNRHFILIEFENAESINAVLASSTHINHDQIIPVQSGMLWFRNSQNTDVQQKSVVESHNIPLSKDSCKPISKTEMFNILLSAQSISDQIQLLYKHYKVNDLGTRIRFYTAYQIERCFHGIFPNIAVLPFGSSVNGFGKQDCDLDLSVIFEEDKLEKSTSRLVYQTKSLLTYEKIYVKRLMETVADVINIFIPGINNVKKILGARVPIIKFNHSLTGIECDLCLTNMSAFYMSELLYVYGEIDSRVRPLIFCVRLWAECLQLTTKLSPGSMITNFSLSLLVLFFLQQKKILPPLNLLKSYATKDDIRIADSYIDCTFTRDIQKILKHNTTVNEESLESLLLDFFIYYSNFDFETKAVSIREGKSILKPEYTALYICNPLETTLNVSQNVKFDELERIRVALRNASWQLEAMDDNHIDEWGLVQLFSNTNIHKTARKISDKQIHSLNFEEIFKEDNSKFIKREGGNVKRKSKKNKSKSHHEI